jgi:phage-related protein
MARITRPISSIVAARKDSNGFPEGAQDRILAALTIAAEGGKPDIAKPLRGLGAGVWEVALPYRGDAFRVVYVIEFADELWVVHAFKKKSVQGIKTPRHEIDLVASRIRRLKELLQ